MDALFKYNFHLNVYRLTKLNIKFQKTMYLTPAQMKTLLLDPIVLTIRSISQQVSVYLLSFIMAFKAPFIPHFDKSYLKKVPKVTEYLSKLLRELR